MLSLSELGRSTLVRVPTAKQSSRTKRPVLTSRGALALAFGLLGGGCASLDPEPPESFSEPGGLFASVAQVELGSRLEDAVIHFTRDGKAPTVEDPVYAAPLQLEQTTEVRSLAVGADGRMELMDGLFLRVSDGTVDFSSNLPVLVVHMLGAPEPSAESFVYERAGMLMFEPSDVDGRTRLADPPTVVSRVGFKVRGRTSRYDDKHGFSLELWGTVDQDDVSRSLLGMPEESDWALYAPYKKDRCYMRNALMYALSNDMGRYAVRTRFVELFIVGDHDDLRASDYAGVYMFMERLTRNAERIDVKKNKGGPDEDISGGYIVEIDQPGPNEQEVGFEIDGMRLEYVYPKVEDITPAQQEYLTTYLENVVSAIEQAADGVDRGVPHYSELIDVDSFIDFHILNTFSKNPDALRLSSYMHKERGQPLAAGPIWDFDRALGSYDERSKPTSGWSPGGDGTQLFAYKFWGALFADEGFRRSYIRRFRDVLAGPLSERNVHAHIDRFAAELEEAAVRNSARWPDARPWGGEFSNEVSDLRKWTSERLRWMEEQLEAGELE